MGYMSISHKQIIIPYLGNTMILLGSLCIEVNSGCISITDFKPCYSDAYFCLADLHQLMWIDRYDYLSQWSRPLTTTWGRWPYRHQFYIRSYDRKGATDTSSANQHGYQLWLLDQSNYSTTAAHLISALATNSPSTSARHSNAQILRLLLTNFASSINWSPAQQAF